MTDQEKNKVTLALANSFLQSATFQQALQIVQEKALERWKKFSPALRRKKLRRICVSKNPKILKGLLKTAKNPLKLLTKNPQTKCQIQKWFLPLLEMADA